MNRKIQFELRRIEKEELLLLIYLNDRTTIEQDQKAFNCWIEDLYFEVIFDMKKAIKYFDLLVNLEDQDIEEKIEWLRKEHTRIQAKAQEQERKNKYYIKF